MPLDESIDFMPDNKTLVISIIGLFLGLIAIGLPLIGVTLNIYLGAIILAIAFVLLAYCFWQWEKTRSWGDAARASTLWTLGLIYFGLIGFQIWLQYHKAHRAEPNESSLQQSAKSQPPRASGGPLPAPSITPQQSVSPSEKPAKRHAQSKPKASTPRYSATPPTTSAPGQAVPGPGSLVQSNSGGVNVQQGTTGINSPIINSPITIGDTPKAITPLDMANVVRFLGQAKSPVTVVVTADQYSGAAPFPDDFYDALKAAGWSMRDAGVSRMMLFSSPGKPFQGAIMTEKGEPFKPGEGAGFVSTDPESFIAALLDAYKIPRLLERSQAQPAGQITVQFQGGFAK